RNVVRHRTLSDHYHAPGGTLLQVTDHTGSRTNKINFRQNIWWAFRMRQNFDVRKLFLVGTHVSGGEAFVNFTMAFPENDLDFGLAGDVAAKKFVGQKYNSSDAERFDHFNRIGRGAANI